MRKALAFSFFVLGGTSVVVQVLLIRELLIVFYGNEFFIGWTLFGWLAWTAAGAFLAGPRGLFARGGWRLLTVCHALAAVLFPALIAAVRYAHTGLAGVPGAVPDLLPAMGFALAALAPMCLLFGAQFVLAARVWSGTGAFPGAGSGAGPGSGYALETAGFAVGGLLLSGVLMTANEFRVAGLLGGLNALAGFGLCRGFRSRTPGLRLWLILALALLVPLVQRSGQIARWTAAWRFPGQVLVASRNTIYGNLALTAVGRQLNYYENGLLLGAEDEQLASEQLVHYPMLWHPAPRRVLLVGGGFNGALGEILKHAPERVEYVELDPRLIDLARRFAAGSRREALADPRVVTVYADGRAYLNRLAAAGPAAGYDVVILNLPGPGTALLNRYYSREFFRDVRRQLAPGGVLAVRLAFSPDYLGPELENLGASIDRTLRAEFGCVALLPDYELLYLATAGGTPAPTAADLIARYRQRGLKTDFVIPPAMAERLGTDRIAQVEQAFAANAVAQINRDLRPVACAYTQIYWLRSFHPLAARVAARLSGCRGSWGVGAAGVLLLGMWLAVRRRPERAGPWAMGVGGFTMMACELVLLLGFQAICGYLYHTLALVLAVMMVGMAAGAGLATGMTRAASPTILAGIHAGLAGYSVVVMGALRALPGATAGAPAAVTGVFLVLAALLGLLVGFEFPVAGRVFHADKDGTQRADVVYGADLVGSCLGALLIGLWALPAWGMEITLLILAGLNLAVSLGLFRQSSRSIGADS